MKGSYFGTMAMAAALAGSIACSDTTAPATGQVSMNLSRSAGAALQSAIALFSSPAGVNGSIQTSEVTSLTITVTDIQVRQVIDDEAADTLGWIAFALDDAVELDLMALPVEGDSPVTIATGTLPEGDYAGVRLMISGANIVLNTTIAVGQATFAADSTHAVRIPSAENTGLKTDIAFTVEADTDVNLLFSPDATFQNVTATGNGQVILAPVIKAPNTEQ